MTKRTALAILFLLAAATAARNYHKTTIDKITSGTFVHTHAEVQGFVAYHRDEGDGDVHFGVCLSKTIKTIDRKNCIEAEVIPTLLPSQKFQLPKNGDSVLIRGIVRFDKEANHGWWEIHPVEFIKIL